ncbi:hypothetical protein CEP51_012736 [Fusarium floridanum]|uniref:Uncharacterized protein n=1 Tax=Fusarium floridanum TaxID=1325733 RepID=A0A428QNN2_9HYPO|nr:hypothetical protein CEP51_012736 [Fusarium floridanum]
MFVAAERLVEALQGIAQHSTAQHTGPTDDTKTRWFWGLGWTDWDALGSGAPLHDPHHWAGLTQGNRAPVPSIGTVTRDGYQIRLKVNLRTGAYLPGPL